MVTALEKLDSILVDGKLVYSKGSVRDAIVQAMQDYSEERLTDFKDRLVSAVFSEPTIPVERKHTLKKLIDNLKS
jgi:hypothetical protein